MVITLYLTRQPVRPIHVACSESRSSCAGYASRCLDDNHSSTANGAKVDLYYCNNTKAQQWTLEPDGTVRNAAAGPAMCLDDTAWGGQGTRQELYTCNGGANQQWSYSGGHWVNAANGLCLNDPGYSTTPGVQQILWACGSYANERYTLP